MTKARRTEIRNIKIELENNKRKLEAVLNEEEFSYGNMPENLQSSMRGEESEEAIDILEEAIDNLSEVIDSIGGI